jgi:hypothetical protein
LAYLDSVVATLFPAFMQGHHGEAPVYFEPATVITTPVLLAQVLELRARSQTGGAKVQRNGDMGSPRVSGSINASSAGISRGSCSTDLFRPAPECRTRSVGNGA